MFKLLYKDFKLFHKSMWLVIVFAGFITLFYQKVLSSFIAYTFASTLIAYAMCISVMSQGEMNKGDKVIASLPLTRKEIVLSRYLSYGVIASLSYVLVFSLALLTRLVLPKLFIALPNVDVLLCSIMILGLFLSIITPLTYKYGYRVARIINSLVYMFFLLAPNLFVIYGKRYKTQTDMASFMEKVSSLNVDLNLMLLVLPAVIITLSMLTSMRIYGNKDIN